MTREEIRANTSMKDLLARYGVTVRSGRCKCFVHGGHNQSMSIYKDRIAHCFKCGGDLDVFAVVQHFENCTFAEAKEKLGGKETVTLKMKQRARTALIKQTQLDVAQMKYDKALANWCACDYIRSYYAQTKDDKIYPYFVYAMQNISRYQQILEESEVRLFELRSKL